jgi:type II secretory pathway pseudopilin PulG
MTPEFFRELEEKMAKRLGLDVDYEEVAKEEEQQQQQQAAQQALQTMQGGSGAFGGQGQQFGQQPPPAGGQQFGEGQATEGGPQPQQVAASVPAEHTSDITISLASLAKAIEDQRDDLDG